MKITFLLIAVLLLVAGQAAAQNAGLTNEQKMLPFATGMSLAVLRERHENNFQDVVDRVGRQIRYYSEELKPVRELTKNTPPMTRRTVVDQAVDELRAKMSRSDRWQFLAGDALGTLYVEIGSKIEAREPLDAETIRFQLNLLERLTENTPADIPSEIAGKLKEIGALGQSDALTDKATIDELIGKTVELIAIISGE
ncbi:MAG: hypothetical protein JSS81_02305 [Acidobacteria bacterium]|nr:hypothetical protein [Acidobacteriota bacterium]